ncbi:response regulator-like protein [Diaporthe sp. PMI_573]|nr:response regulator-like protein [Diaporthaceae sp. PMI_573]
MPPEGDMAAQTGGSNSSDFVRKLYKMLEDPQYSSVVRWGNEGDSFVVLENEKFTKTILPKHFKHSNFASFVRQLNKYDFHKVRQNEENGQSPYGPQAWEFKHPEFRMDQKHNLDNIRRKAPAPRKAQPTEEVFPANQQVALLSETLNATQHQVQQLQENYFTLAQSNKVLIDEITSLKKTLNMTTQVNHELLNHLTSLDERRRSSRHSAHSNHSGQASANFHNGTLGVLPDGNDEPSAELRRARELMTGIEPDPVADRAFHRLSMAWQTQTPPDSASSQVAMYPQPSSAAAAAVAMPAAMMHNPFVEDPRHLVYPVGQTVGIDPFHPDHIQHVPYFVNQSGPSEPQAQITPPPGKEMDTSLWGPKKPRIFLVEDDKTCSRIGSKFLSQVECSVEVARDGEEASSKINNDPDRFDLIFMDIIMPICDGISATVFIRAVNSQVPIIAMTSNIRQEDISSYYSWGMNGVLAKPFTKDGMIRILKQHLRHLLKNPAAADVEPNGVAPVPVPSGSTPSYSGMPSGTMSTAGSTVKFESGTPIQSPATTGSWHSPGQQLAHASPNLDAGGYMTAGGGVSGPQMVMTPGGMHRGGFPQQVGTPPIQRMPDSMGDERPEKRQRMYGPGPGGYMQQ